MPISVAVDEGIDDGTGKSKRRRPRVEIFDEKRIDAVTRNVDKVKQNWEVCDV